MIKDVTRKSGIFELARQYLWLNARVELGFQMVLFKEFEQIDE
jgi:hypothetical protein